MINNICIKNRNNLNMSIRLNIDEHRHKLAFLEHGLGARKEYPHMLVLENFFVTNGYNVVSIDALDSNNESDKSNEGITFTGHYNDLADAINWAKTQKFYKEPFALAGQSLGAQAVILYAGNYPEKVKLLLPVAFCWIDGKEESKYNTRREIIETKGFAEKVSESSGKSFLIKMNYLDDLEKYNLTNTIKKIKADTYIFIGEKDKEIHKNNSRKLFDLLNSKKKIFILPNVPHDLANTKETKETFENALKEIASLV